MRLRTGLLSNAIASPDPPWSACFSPERAEAIAPRVTLAMAALAGLELARLQEINFRISLQAQTNPFSGVRGMVGIRMSSLRGKLWINVVIIVMVMTVMNEIVIAPRHMIDAENEELER